MIIAPSDSIRAAEQAAFRSGATTSAALMDAVVARLHRSVQDTLPPFRRCVVYAGKGNNAGDAVGLAARLGLPTLLRCACGVAELSPDTQQQLAQLSDWQPADTAPGPEPGTLILDGLLGSGATGPLRPSYAALVEEMNTLRAASTASLLLAIDIPTGLAANPAPTATHSVLADATAVIGCAKPPMLTDGAEQAVGRLLPIPLPEVELAPTTPDLLMDDALLRSFLPRRANNCFKNRAGRVAIVAGSPGMAGAAQMCAEAALAAGAGLVALYAHRDIYPILAARVAAEIMVQRIDSFAEVHEPTAQCLLLGPGLGPLGPTEAAALYDLADNFPGTVVLDADALNCAAAYGWDLAPHANWALTPHPGEMRRLAPQLAPLPRREQIAHFCENSQATLLLKGARSLIAQRDQCLYNSSGGPYMANGGQGDVLAGCIAGLAAQGLRPLQAAAAGAYACGRAAELAWREQGMPRAVRATQLLPWLGRVLG